MEIADATARIHCGVGASAPMIGLAEESQIPLINSSGGRQKAYF
jgi:hypothetical protein